MPCTEALPCRTHGLSGELPGIFVLLSAGRALLCSLVLSTSQSDFSSCSECDTLDRQVIRYRPVTDAWPTAMLSSPSRPLSLYTIYKQKEGSRCPRVLATECQTPPSRPQPLDVPISAGSVRGSNSAQLPHDLGIGGAVVQLLQQRRCAQLQRWRPAHAARHRPARCPPRVISFGQLP